jgi:hypothetical protein
MLNLNLNIVGAGGRSNIGAGPDVGPTTTTTTTTTTSTTTTSTTTTAGPVSFRTDPYSASLQLAFPGAYFPSLGMTAYNEDVSQLIRGTGTGYGVLPTFTYASASFSAATAAPIPKWVSNNYSSSMQVTSHVSEGYIATTSASADFNNLNSSSFTIETWVNQNDWNSSAGACEVYRAYSGGPLLFTLQSLPSVGSNPQIETILIRTDGSEFVYEANPYVLSPNNWYHTAVVRDGNNYNMLLNGEVVLSFQNSAVLKNLENPLIMGRGGSSPYSASFQDFRLYKGVAKYAYQPSGSTYTPPLSMIL